MTVLRYMTDYMTAPHRHDGRHDSLGLGTHPAMLVQIPVGFLELYRTSDTQDYSCGLVRRHRPKHMFEIIATQGVREYIWVIRGR